MFSPFLPHSFSQGIPSPSPSIFELPDCSDFTASEQEANVLQDWADAARGVRTAISSSWKQKALIGKETATLSIARERVALPFGLFLKPI